MQQPTLILIGGFLGAGKTTLLARSARRLAERGQRVGMVTNDQASDLVDTAILKESQAAVEEVSGGCFCCRFGDLVAAMDRLRESDSPDVLFGEPVGSCTDLSATVLQPIKKDFSDRFRLAPFSVLVDVKQVRTLDRLRASLGHASSPRFPDNVMYIYEKQLEEADVIVLNKADLLPAAELAEVEESLIKNFPQAPVMTVSALHDVGVESWLDYVLGSSGAGRTIAEVDYDEYADGEAALGWLNASVRLQGKTRTDWRAFCLALMQQIQRRCQAVAAEIAHLKLHLTAGGRNITANLTSNEGTPWISGSLEADSSEASLLLNIRANTAPTRLLEIAKASLQSTAEAASTQCAVDHLQSFSPGRPQPTHRYRATI
jgi:G3E family GTPase